MGNEFEHLKDMMSDTLVINTTAKNWHVGEIDQMIRTIKRKSRCIFSDFKKIGVTPLPYAVIKALINFVVMWNNAFFSTQGVLQELPLG